MLQFCFFFPSALAYNDLKILNPNMYTGLDKTKKPPSIPFLTSNTAVKRNVETCVTRDKNLEA